MSAHHEQLTLFAMPAMCPTWPQRGTLADKALALLLDGRSLDHPTFEAEEGSWRLAATVFCLRELGWPIQTDHTSEPTPTCPSRTIAKYYLRDRDLLFLMRPIDGLTF